MADQISQFITAKFGPAIRHDEPLEFTVAEFREAARQVALEGDLERTTMREALIAIRDLSPHDALTLARRIARQALAVAAAP